MFQLRYMNMLYQKIMVSTWLIWHLLLFFSLKWPDMGLKWTFICSKFSLYPSIFEKWLDYWWNGQKIWWIYAYIMKKLALYLKYPGGLGRFEFCTHKCQNKTLCYGVWKLITNPVFFKTRKASKNIWRTLYVPVIDMFFPD